MKESYWDRIDEQVKQQLIDEWVQKKITEEKIEKQENKNAREFY